MVKQPFSFSATPNTSNLMLDSDDEDDGIKTKVGGGGFKVVSGTLGGGGEDEGVEIGDNLLDSDSD